jgi:hypothetical protein
MLRLRIPLEAYFQGGTAKVYSLVAAIPFSPIDLDLNLLARGEWEAFHDRFRICYLPRVEEQNDKPIFYVMIRKFDKQQGILVCAHIVMNLEPEVTNGKPQPNFTVGILSNDEIRARSMLGTMLGIPPIFHRRSEITLIERRWRTDPESVMRFTANVYSVSASGTGPGGEGLPSNIPAAF